MRLIGYVRVSTKGQAERFGPVVQEQEIRAWARRGGHRILRVEHDLGESGTRGVADALADDDRPVREGLTRAVAAVAIGKADGIVVHELTRLARSMMWQEVILDQLARKGGRVFAVRSNDDGLDEPTRNLVRQVLGAIAQFEHAMIVARLSGGKAAKRAQGGYTGGAPRYGARADLGKHELVVDPAELAVARRIRRLHRQGLSIRAIAANLNAEQIPAKRGGRWHATTVARVLRRTP